MSSDASTSSTGSEAPSGRPSERGPRGGRPSHEEEVSVLDLLLVLARNKTLIVRTVLIFFLLGFTYAVFAPEEYTSSARVVRETQSDGGISLPGGISPGMLSGFGINLGGASSGLTPQAFPDVLHSREVQLAVARDTFRFPDTERPMTVVDYVNRPGGALGTVLKYTIKLPWTLKRKFGEISDPPSPAGTASDDEPEMLTVAEDETLEELRDMVETTVDEETGFMTIAVTAQGPRLASNLAQSFVHHLTNRVREIRTKKVRKRLQFVKSRFQEAEEKLEVAENRLAQFLERNQNPTSARLEFQRDRLQRQVSFKEQLYSELQSQLTQTRLDLQRRQPVVTVAEEPAPPIERSAPRRTLIVLLSLILGGGVAVGLAFVRSFVEDREDDPEDREKMDEIRERFLENSVWGGVKKRVWGRGE
jgi:uncharacterized protein involved in exopolysaccharide biosynthesis